jgi:tetratricopeptide (TPR) repeat protein
VFYAAVDVKNFTMANGDIDYGELVRYWRKEVIHWHHTHELVALYNEFMNEDISIRWWQRMEKQNKVPVDQKRRLVIARLLGLPVLYLGLPFSEMVAYSEEVKLPIPTTETVNLREYETRLLDMWATPYGKLEEALTRIYALQRAFVYGGAQQREQVSRLLCHYLLSVGNVQRAEGCLTSAIAHLNDAIQLASEKNYDDLLAKALYMRGYCHIEKWGVGREKGHTDFVQALADFHAAYGIVETLEKQNSQPVRGAILAEWGSTLAHQTQDVRDRSEALGKLDAAGKIVNASHFRSDPYFLNVNVEWYHIDKAEAFIALRSPKLAIEEITTIYRGNARTKRRYLTATIIEAEAYISKGQIEIGTEYAIDALKVAGDVSSKLHLVRLDYLYNSLRQQVKYKSSSDVARLGVELLKIQHPTLFH